MNKILTILLLMLAAIPGVSATTIVEKDNYMPVYYQFAYWEQIYEQDPTNADANYHLDILAGQYSTNGKYSGLNVGMEYMRLRTVPEVPNYHDIVFVDNVVDWYPTK